MTTATQPRPFVADAAIELVPASDRAKPAQPVIELVDVGRRFPGTQHPALDRVSLAVWPGELLAILGPSGCGKTTCLRLVAGFERPDAGEVFIDGQRAAGQGVWMPPERRGIGMVFQEGALFPHLTAAQNVAFGLRGLARSAQRERVGELLHLVGLAELGDRYPHELSGGQQQRIALARALAPRPHAVLLDEPFNSLDASIRKRVRHEVVDILRRQDVAAVLVTHDQEEALSTADRIAVLNQGRLEQVDEPTALYHLPASRMVAEFVGAADFLPAEIRGGRICLEIGELSAPADLPPGPAELMVRPDDVVLGVTPSGEAVVAVREFRGADVVYTLCLPSGRLLHSRRPASEVLLPGTCVQPALSLSHAVLFRGSSALTVCCALGTCACLPRARSGPSGQ